MNKLQKDPDELLVRYQNSDVEGRLASIYGDRFIAYRKSFAEAQHYYEHSGKYPDFPLTISFEMSNKCNLACSMCYLSTAAAREEKFVGLTVDVIAKVLEECSRHGLPSVILGSGTEFMFSKNAVEVINLVAGSSIMDVFLRTNGILLNREASNLILDSGIARVFISLDASTRATYRAVRGRDALELIEQNIIYLLEERARRKTKLPIIRVSFVILEKNKHEQKSFLDKWKNVADYVDFQRYQDLSHVNDNDDGQIDNMLIKVPFCSYPFYNLSILPDGNVAPCCTYYGQKIPVGNVYEQSVQEIWHGAKMNEIRHQILMKRFNVVCKRCLYYRDNNLADEI